LASFTCTCAISPLGSQRASSVSGASSSACAAAQVSTIVRSAGSPARRTNAAVSATVLKQLVSAGASGSMM
jgi:hypothetical protein